MASSKRALKALSGALLERGALEGEEIRAIVSKTVKAPDADISNANEVPKDFSA
jgi:hypothetical protein